MKKNKSIKLNFRITEEEFLQLKAKAKKFTKGNVSNFLRYSFLNMEKTDGDISEKNRRSDTIQKKSTKK